MSHAPLMVVVVTAALCAGCSNGPPIPEPERFGAHPHLPSPQRSLIPTVNIAPARGWRDGKRPRPAAGWTVVAFASDLVHPRWLHVLPNGDVLVAESDAPPKPADNKGLRGWFMKRVMKRAGSGLPSADRIRLLRDADGDGVAEFRSVFLSGLHSPFGMALVGDTLFVANADALVRFPYTTDATSIAVAPTRVVELPGGPINHHWTKNLLASPDGAHLYVAVGSNSNIAENGMQAEEHRAAILEVDARTGATRVFASGLRNPVGMGWQPDSGELWVAVNERDELGDDLVPDYLTHVEEGGFYGWPYSYWGAHVDARVAPPRPDLVARALVPDYSLGAHTASLGLAFHDGKAVPARYRGGAFIGQHGSWNRSEPVGYKVVFVPFEAARPAGLPEDILTGFLTRDGDAYGRPVGVAVARDGAVLIADDVGDCVWRVSSAQPIAGKPH